MDLTNPATFSWSHFRSRREDTLHRKLCELNIQNLQEFGRLAAWTLVVFFTVALAGGILSYTGSEPHYTEESQVVIYVAGLATGLASLGLVSSNNSNSISWLTRLQSLFFTLYLVQQLYALAIPVVYEAVTLDQILDSSSQGLLYLAAVWLVAESFRRSTTSG
mmetsp:Transcript_33386/g.58536  ORF Transcript_33386/g.58536 Transcript_33386/m.58536 type:complete len:163 (+) Transcript_33386:173-661(+)